MADINGEDDRSMKLRESEIAGVSCSRRVFTALVASSLGTLFAIDNESILRQSDTFHQAHALEPLSGATHWTRLEGANRYETADAIYRSVCGLLGGFDEIILATGTNYPDALSASGLAGICRAPLLLIPGATISTANLDELSRIVPQTVYLVGGRDVISEEVEQYIRERVGDEAVNRLAGADRRETALAVYRAGLDDTTKMSAWGDLAIIATGANFPDALSAAPLAFAAQAPTFLTDSGGDIAEAVYEALQNGGFTRVLIVGGDSVVSSEIDGRLAAMGLEVTRASGDNRYHTSLAIADYAIGKGYLDHLHPCIATGNNFPDALAGGLLAGLNRSVLLLADDCKTAPLLSFLNDSERLQESISGYFLGGLQAVSPYIESIVRRISDADCPIILPDNRGGYSRTNVQLESGLVDRINGLTLHPQWPSSGALGNLIDRVLRSITYEEMSNFDKLRAVYEYLIINFDYGYLTTSSYAREARVYAALTENIGTCYEYSSTLFTIARQIGLPVYIVEGTTQLASGDYGEHYWNEIDVGGNVYVLDANVDDSIASRKGCIWYYSFCRAYAQIPDQYRGGSRIT
ncbi:MAG: hypothetical protein GX562_07035 [Coriobacteriaceae bacterium]|nr:hypothetical protein [Coriobacteriaceae bacterium]